MHRSLLLLLPPFIALALAAPPLDSRIDLSELQFQAQSVLQTGSKVAHAAVDQFEAVLEGGREFLRNQDFVYLRTTHAALPESYQLRTNKNSSSLCDPSVKQYSGYLDAGARHFFYWFFESRNAPETAPLILWLNGGPGCSSTTGLLFELGPCRVSGGGQSTVHNNHSWNEFANIVFLDQPIEVGFSYADDGSNVDNSADAGVDVWAFLELFMKQFPEYAKLPFHIAAESYGGHYAPNIASVIHKKNLERAIAPTPDFMHINLQSVVLANGLTEPHTQFASIPDYACQGPYPIYDNPNGAECEALRAKVPTCQSLVSSCYSFDSRFTCVPASLYCNAQLLGPIQSLGLNPYDVRRTCDRKKDGDLCYKQLEWIDTYLNKPDVKKSLGVSSSMQFQSCNLDVNKRFLFQGDTARNSAKLLIPLLQGGIRLLVYAGEADSMCNFLGNHRWMEKLEGHPFQDGFRSAPIVPWLTLDANKPAGHVRAAGPGAGNYTFVAVSESGHMVPYDQPEAALDLISRWVLNVPLAFTP